MFLLFLNAILLVVSCQEEHVLGTKPQASDVKFSVTQETGFDNRVYLENQMAGVIPFWDYSIGNSTKQKDTVVFIFPGDYWIKFSAFGAGGSSDVDSVKVHISNLCGDCITDEGLINLTDRTTGKFWKLFRITLGPASGNGDAVWADVNWWDPGTTNMQDSAYFDLNNAFNYIRYHNGQKTKSSFTFNSDEMLTGSILPNAGKSILIPPGNQMPIADGSGEMADADKTKYRIFKLNADTLVVGQGSYYTASRTTEDWGFFHWYVRAK